MTNSHHVKKTRLPGKADKVTRLMNQVDRARKLASEFGAGPLAELYELHAQLCQQNAESRQDRRGRPSAKEVENA